MILVWYFGFYKPALRDHTGKIDPRLWFGHCEAWGCNEDGTWVFLDPQGRGMRVSTLHRYDDVQDRLMALMALCDTIVRFQSDREFRLPLRFLATCATICGSLVGVRASLPWTLKRKLLSHGGEVTHGTQT